MKEIARQLFVYGSLKPGELGFEQIRHFVSEHRSATLPDFSLYVRDGLPVIKSQSFGEAVSGNLLSIYPEMESEFWTVVTEYEGTSNYKLEKSLTVVSEGKKLLAAAFVGRKMNKGNPIKLATNWRSKFDPILSQSFPALHHEIAEWSLTFTDAEHDPGAYWKQMNKLLSHYLLLVSILEHLTVVIFGGSKKQEPMLRIGKLQKSLEFSNVFDSLGDPKFNPPIRVSDSRQVEDSLSTSNPKQALLAWYQVRSNLQHRGKASLFDAELVHKSCVGLSNFLFEYLAINVTEIHVEWERVLGSKVTKIEFSDASSR